jgi:hypothetical protein
MKTKLTTILPVFILIFLFCACNKNTGEKETQLEITGIVISQSDCLSKIKELSASEADSNQSCIVYNYDAANKRLNITHGNAGFNCCPGAVTCAISFSNDTITIEEIPEYAICNCDCLFNLEIEVNGVLSKTYYLEFVEPYVGDQEKLEFMIDIPNQTSGEYCVERNEYPWGT